MWLCRIIAVSLCGALFLHDAAGAAQKQGQRSRKRYRSSGANSKPLRAPKVSAATRQEASEGVLEKISSGVQIPLENPAALVPFFEQLYKRQTGEVSGPVHVLQYGDSHTAADEWTGDLRERFQEKFGDGGSGYVYAGRPYRGYRNFTAKAGSTKGWRPEGINGRRGDGALGMGGIAMSATKPREAVYLETEGDAFEVFYLRQPGGGAFGLYDSGELIETVSTDGPLAPAYYRYETDSGLHRLEVETIDGSPVRLFGWSADKPKGVTYEPLGINGASATMILDWDEAVFGSNIARRNPGLIVLAYGTNEAGRKDWTVATYREAYERILAKIRNAAPTAAIMVIGPPDRHIRTRKGWVPLSQVDTIIEAQRQAALAQNCAFWDLRAKMGGKGAMRQWVLAGMGQSDYAHFTAPGYRMMGDAVFRDIMSQYETFLRVRQPLTASTQPSASPLANPR